MTTAPEAPEATDAIGEPTEETPVAHRFITLRSILIALILAVGFSVLIPWNDWFLKNTYLNNHYMPLGLTLVLLVMGMVVNPLLGRFRLLTGEMVVIAVVMLGLAGVTSSGLMRMLPFMMTGPASVLPTNPRFANTMAERGEPGPGGERGPITQWNVPHQLWIGIEAQGDIDRNDPEFRHVVEGYLRGMPRGDERDTLRVTHRSIVTWEDAAGQKHRQLALAGRQAQYHADDPQVLNLDDPMTGLPFVGQQADRQIALPEGNARILAIEAPSLPWYAWPSALLAWAPLLIGALLACIGIAGVVRRQ
ncbi:MAG: hypothetical protein EA402_01620, partial [Planctomycetota bacterium]